jgi:hypothetical protein
MISRVECGLRSDSSLFTRRSRSEDIVAACIS